mmetsp:Transcript_6960/g.25604  ORF Transcript_6960/g.25604 Transcript_6960/m.25604 type:complete len:422 (+) Transcript_6960:1217-2482(+)|eukprot:30918-Pelagococcus_subviridis.AAC.72
MKDALTGTASFPPARAAFLRARLRVLVALIPAHVREHGVPGQAAVAVPVAVVAAVVPVRGDLVVLVVARKLRERGVVQPGAVVVGKRDVIRSGLRAVVVALVSRVDVLPFLFVLVRDLFLVPARGFFLGPGRGGVAVVLLVLTLFPSLLGVVVVPPHVLVVEEPVRGGHPPSRLLRRGVRGAVEQRPRGVHLGVRGVLRELALQRRLPASHVLGELRRRREERDPASLPVVQDHLRRGVQVRLASFQESSREPRDLLEEILGGLPGLHLVRALEIVRLDARDDVRDVLPRVLELRYPHYALEHRVRVRVLGVVIDDPGAVDEKDSLREVDILPHLRLPGYRRGDADFLRPERVDHRRFSDVRVPDEPDGDVLLIHPKARELPQERQHRALAKRVRHRRVKRERRVLATQRVQPPFRDPRGD